MKQYRIQTLLGLLIFSLLSGCSSLDPFNKYELSKPQTRQCLYLKREIAETKGVIKGQYIFPAGYYRPIYADTNGTYYAAPKNIVLNSLISENLNGGGIYLQNNETLHAWSYPKLGTYGNIKVNGIEQDAPPPGILFAFSNNVKNLITFTSC